MNIDDTGPVYNPQDTPGVNPWGQAYPTGSWRNPVPPAPPPVRYPTGPPQRRGYASSSTASAPPPDPWAGVPGAVHDQALALTDKFLASMGYPKGLDNNTIAQALAKSGLNVTGSAAGAYDWLFVNAPGMTDALRNSNPQAELGMDKDLYATTANGLNNVMFDYTGQQFDQATLKQALREGWTPPEIRNFAQYGNTSGAGDFTAQAQFSGDMPWLSQGQTFSQTLQGFESFEGHTPTDKQSLAAWFRFGSSARQLRSSQEAVGAAAPRPLLAGTEVR